MCFTTWLILKIQTENHPRAGHAGDRTHDLWVIFGGAGNSEKFNDVLAYEFKTNKWKTLHSGKDKLQEWTGHSTLISENLKI